MRDTSTTARPPGPSFSRRSLLRGGVRVAGGIALAGAAPSLLAACSSSSKKASTAASSAQTTDLSYQLSWVPDVEFAGSYLAKDRGYYSKHGLDVGFRAGGASVSVEPVVTEGKALVGSSNADTVAEAVAQGAPLKIIGARFQVNPFCIISGASKPIDAPKDMYGKSIGVSSANEEAWKTFVALNKLDVSKITVVPVQDDPTPLAAGEVDGWMGYITDEPTQLSLKGFAVHTFLFADFGYKIFADIYEVTESSIATKKEELAAFLAAEREGWQADLSDPAAGVTAAKPYFLKSGLTAAQQALENKAQLELISTPYTRAHGLFTMNPDDIAANISTMKVAGISASADLFDSSILEMI